MSSDSNSFKDLALELVLRELAPEVSTEGELEELNDYLDDKDSNKIIESAQEWLLEELEGRGKSNMDRYEEKVKEHFSNILTPESPLHATVRKGTQRILRDSKILSPILRTELEAIQAPAVFHRITTFVGNIGRDKPIHGATAYNAGARRLSSGFLDAWDLYARVIHPYRQGEIDKVESAAALTLMGLKYTPQVQSVARDAQKWLFESVKENISFDSAREIAEFAGKTGVKGVAAKNFTAGLVKRIASSSVLFMGTSGLLGLLQWARGRRSGAEVMETLMKDGGGTIGTAVGSLIPIPLIGSIAGGVIGSVAGGCLANFMFGSTPSNPPGPPANPPSSHPVPDWYDIAWMSDDDDDDVSDDESDLDDEIQHTSHAWHGDGRFSYSLCTFRSFYVDNPLPFLPRRVIPVDNEAPSSTDDSVTPFTAIDAGPNRKFDNSRDGGDASMHRVPENEVPDISESDYDKAPPFVTRSTDWSGWMRTAHSHYFGWESQEIGGQSGTSMGLRGDDRRGSLWRQYVVKALSKEYHEKTSAFSEKEFWDDLKDLWEEFRTIKESAADAGIRIVAVSDEDDLDDLTEDELHIHLTESEKDDLWKVLAEHARHRDQALVDNTFDEKKFWDMLTDWRKGLTQKRRKASDVQTVMETEDGYVKEVYMSALEDVLFSSLE